MSSDPVTSFHQLALPPALLTRLEQVGYSQPSPIQARTIPLLLEGRDVLGQAQTGTGKTAAFALPLLARLEPGAAGPQVLVLAPTRELAIQVAAAFDKYAAGIPGFRALAVYGGQDYATQLRALKRGASVVVGTPGRIMDHMRRGTLKLDNLRTLVLDEADEMLRMGFIDDVEWILGCTPEQRQVALFSATMPAQIRRIANRHLHEPAQVTIEAGSATASTIRQRYWPVKGLSKLDALSRILEAEDRDGVIIFVRTRNATVELTEKLQAGGHASAALNGDIAQHQRERVVEKFKRGGLDVLVATDVAARGLDVERVSHVVNYDMPHDTEAYVHRIGRTGRAGRSGQAILFVAPRERRMLGAIEKATGQRIEVMALPSTEQINERRIARFKQRIDAALEGGDLAFHETLLKQYQEEKDVSPLRVAAALASLLQDANPLPLPEQAPAKQARDKPARADGGEKRRDSRRKDVPAAGQARPERTPVEPPESGMERFRIEVGHEHQVKPGNIVGAIANEAELDSKYIGRIDIRDDHSLVDLPEGMPREIFRHLKTTWVAGRQMRISRLEEVRGGKPGAGRKRRGRVGA